MKKVLGQACAFFLVLTGCEKEVEITDLVVRWSIGLESPDEGKCRAAGISSVYVALDSLSESFEREVPCSTGEVNFEGLPRTGYRLSVSGLNDGGCPIYYGEKDISAADMDDGWEALRLEQLTASGKVEVSWWFSDGRFCSHHGVEDVRVIIFLDDVEIVNRKVDCDSGSYTMSDAATGTYSIRLEAEADDGPLCTEYHALPLVPCGVIEAGSPLGPCVVVK